MKLNKAVFLDLNGTIVLPIKQESLDDLHLIPGADVAISKLIESGFVCPIVTVQSRIEKGLFSEEQFRKWFISFFDKLNLDVKGPYVCPHKFDHPCKCEKPNSYLYDIAAKDFSIDMKKSYTIGDSPQDVEAAFNFGGTGCLVRTGWAEKSEVVEKARPFFGFVGNSIVDAANWIVERESKL